MTIVMIIMRSMVWCTVLHAMGNTATSAAAPLRVFPMACSKHMSGSKFFFWRAQGIPCEAWTQDTPLKLHSIYPQELATLGPKGKWVGHPSGLATLGLKGKWVTHPSGLATLRLVGHTWTVQLKYNTRTCLFFHTPKAMDPWIPFGKHPLKLERYRED